jgi:signal transduction histidine kinase
LRDQYDAALVQVAGTLLDISRRHDRVELEMQSGLRKYVATIHGVDEAVDFPRIGSRLELTGVYVGQGGNRVLGRSIDSFSLLLTSRSDVRVLSNPPWWTLRRMLMVVGLLFGVLFASLVWINLLHRKVESRTWQLTEQIQKRERAEHERKIEQERARLAHDLHDDLGAGLTEANMLALLTTSPGISAEEKERCADEMNGLLLRMVMSLDEIVWAENPRNDTVSSLAGYFTAHAQRLLDLASISFGLDVEENLPELSLDPKFRRELFLAFKEAITNVVQHAEAKKVWLRIAIEGNDLVVVVSDDGGGIQRAGQMAGADGLDNMRDRMHGLGGKCEILSEPGKGTTVRLRAPIQKVET